jgi:hypothetical protein
MVVITCTGFEKAMKAATDETKGAVKAAIRSTLNKVIKTARSMTSGEIRKIYGVSKKTLDERLAVVTARAGIAEAGLTIGGKSVSLSYFNAKQFAGSTVITRKGATKRKRISKFQGVEVEVIKGKRTRLKNAFMQRFKSGHLGILTRVGKKRYPVRVKSSISIASMFEKAAINDAVIAKVDVELEKQFWHELEYYLSKDDR